MPRSPRSKGWARLEHPHPLQTAFIEEQAAQCAYCMNGMIMMAKVLLDKNAHPSEDEIKRPSTEICAAAAATCA